MEIVIDRVPGDIAEGIAEAGIQVLFMYPGTASACRFSSAPAMPHKL